MGRKTMLIQPGNSTLGLNPAELDPLQKALLQGIHFSDLMETGQVTRLTDLADRLGAE